MLASTRTASCRTAGVMAVFLAIVAAQAILGINAANAQTAAPFMNTIPSQYYYQAVFDIYRGEYRNAQRSLSRDARTSVRIGATQRWIDAICYHSMLGEVYYHQGQPRLALEQFDEACAMWLQYPRWMLGVDFRTEPRVALNRSRKVLPWGPSNRQTTLGDVPSQELIQFGDDLATQSQVAQSGGVIRQMQFWKVDVVEVIRAMSVSIRRRNELLGPLAVHDPLSRDLVNKLSSNVAPPHHWSQAYADLLLGLAYVGQGNIDQAFARLQRAERLAGQFDYQLTATSLVEQGRLAMNAGKADTADKLFYEATISAIYYEDPIVIDEAFRLMATNRLGSPHPQSIPILDVAAAWAKRENFNHIFARLSFTRAEEWMLANDWKQAAAVLQGGQGALRDAAPGLLGNWSRYLEARVLTQIGKASAIGTLNAALAKHFDMSSKFLQLQIANQWFDSQQLRASAAAEIYNMMLSDPNPSDWAFHPLDTLAMLKAPLDASYDRWMLALQERKEKSAMLEVADLAKRRRYFGALPLGGRLAALRDTLEAPDNVLSPESRVLRNDLLMRSPDYDNLAREGRKLQEQLRQNWKAGLDGAAQQNVNKLWKLWNNNLEHREALVDQLALSRVPSAFQFPPFVPVEQLQAMLRPGQAIVVFHDMHDGLVGFMLTDSVSTIWNCGPAGKLASDVGQFLRDLGNHDRNNALDEKQLASTDWHQSGKKVFDDLFEGSSLDVSSLEELIVVPDGVVWYVPLTALPVTMDNEIKPLILKSKIRTVPTMGLAIGHSIPWRRVQHSTIAGQEIIPGDKTEERTSQLAKLQSAMPNFIKLPDPLPSDSRVVASIIDALLVLDEFDIERDEPLAWSPLPGGRGNEGSLYEWLNLPQVAPQRMVFAGAHTIAEKGGKTPRRRDTMASPGSELFLTSCGLMSTGAQTVLLSRWRVGGLSTLEIIREFLQELPRTSAADAWQRSVEIARQSPLELTLEPRVKAKDPATTITAAHPFFWGGYLLVDSGEAYVAEEPPVDPMPLQPAAPAAPPVPAGG